MKNIKTTKNDTKVKNINNKKDSKNIKEIKNNMKGQAKNMKKSINSVKEKAKNAKQSKNNMKEKFRIIKGNKEQEKIKEKAKNQKPIRVLYKKSGQDPEVRIIPNVFMLKRAIINKQLEILPYQNVFLVFNKQKEIQTEPINVIFDLCNIKGDLLVVQIDLKKREFESLSQEDVIWFTRDLINKKPVNTNNTKMKDNVIDINYWKALKMQNQNEKQLTKKQIKDYYSKELTLYDTEEKVINGVSFETNLINVLTNIELTLASLLEIKKK